MRQVFREHKVKFVSVAIGVLVFLVLFFFYYFLVRLYGA